jgi:hypothetical protein
MKESKQSVFEFFFPKSSRVFRRSRRILLPEPASLTNSLKICERCRLDSSVAGFDYRTKAHFALGDTFVGFGDLVERVDLGHNFDFPRCRDL